MENSNRKKYSLDGCPTLVEVAMAYFGRFEQRTALKHFKGVVDGNEKLSKDLAEAGYNKWNTFFIPQQILVLFSHIGPPDAVYRKL